MDGRRGLIEDADFKEFLATEYARLVAAVALVTSSRPAAEDAVQEALVRAWERANKGETIDSLNAWVATVALNLSRSGIRRAIAERKAKRRLSRQQLLPEHTPDRIDIERAVGSLPRRQREVVVLRYLMDMDTGAVATTLRISQGTVKSELSLARESLARLDPDRTEVSNDARPRCVPQARTAAIRPDVDPVGLSVELDHRREQRRLTQRLKKVSLVVTVVTGTVLGTLGLTRVFGDASTNPRVAVGPGTGRIVFSNYVRDPSDSSVLTDDWHLYTMNADGSDLVRIGPDSVDEVIHPSWSPDGTRIAFQGWTNRDDGIYVMNADGTDLTEILTTDPTHDIFQIAWSPDGTKIGYIVQEQEQIGPTPVAGAPEVDLHYTIWTVNIDGSDATQRTSEGREFSFGWSPDATKIVFERYGPIDGKSTSDGRDLRVASDLFIMNADGSGEIQLTADGNASDPAWSPDGTRIAYSGDGGPDGGVIDLFVMNADGSNPIRITSDPGNEYNPVWSPDGTEIFYSTREQDPGFDESVCHIRAIAPDGTGERSLIAQPGSVGCPGQEGVSAATETHERATSLGQTSRPRAPGRAR